MEKPINIPKNKTGLCLGGGGALGFAHIGVLRALEERRIFPYRVSGASMGAIVGVLYAAGFDSEQIAHIVKEHKLHSLTNIFSSPRSWSAAGFSGHQKIERLLREYLPHDSFEGLRRPFSLSVVDFRRARSVIVSSGGNLVSYVLASMSLPLAFEPQTIGADTLIDGSILNNLPVEPLLRPCRRIVGVDVHTAPDYYEGPITKTNILPLTYRIMMSGMNRGRAEKCDHCLRFPDLARYGPDDFSHFDEIRRIGYDATAKYIEQHPSILKLADKGK